MQNKHKLIYILLSLFVPTTILASNATEKLEEVIKAAQDTREPAYINDVEEELFRTLLLFARERQIISPDETLSLFFAMHEIIEVIWMAASFSAANAYWQYIRQN